ncbi:MAG: type III-A CRISPR-associated protein Csm2 [Fusobacterium perfoetens]|uniref:type III-A CRISPR-associated protein Csm2 n=1 Tax=Fusobacterium perfoetens TaxID=852 RepID=UPI0023F43944|nr:type III-A CRISPR-associated protein Csm2 [Fusobacterium perfoetens]MCI6152331.1 type III-A CRISPR-associated protein Csm2 [Fusobacterium perfoetens]MDY3238189.1 type III-A CRISPR-associated protein Csm2 [Fusobacterium perfoetens]
MRPNNIEEEKQKFEKNLKEAFIFDEKGYIDIETGFLRENLLTNEAIALAECFRYENLTNSQIRNFFNEVKAIRNILDDKEENWNKVYPMTLMLKSKINYKYNRNKDSEKKLKTLKKFIEKSVDKIIEENKKNNGYETFKNFVIYFEVTMGFAKLKNN